MEWKKEGPIILPDDKYNYLHVAGSVGVLKVGETIWIYISGRNVSGQSLTGRARFNIKSMTVSEYSRNEIIPLGKPGTFDENGTSYPSVFQFRNTYYLLYTGWIKGYHVPWYNSLGIAFSKDGKSCSKLSEGPWLPLD